MTADARSAEEAAGEAADAAQITLSDNPVHLGFSLDDPGEEVGLSENYEHVFYVEYESEGGDGIIDEFSYVDEFTNDIHFVTIETTGNGVQTITHTISDLDGLVKSQYTVQVDMDGNIITDLENVADLQAFLERTVSFSVLCNSSDAAKRLDSLKAKLDKLKSKTITITTATKTKGNNNETISKNAKGTDSFRGGLSLINEEGPELVAANGSASFYGGGYPTIAPIPRGAKIFTAEETAALLGGRVSLPAYAEGTNAYLNF